MREKSNTCCFTGHRDISGVTYAELANRMEPAVRRLIGEGYRYFVCGGAIGFDTFAAILIHSLKMRGEDVHLVLMLPCRDQAAKWSAYDRAVYAQILQKADEVVYIGEKYTPGCMQMRNRAMVDAASTCICYLTQMRGGTWQTVNYAGAQGLSVINVASD